MDDEKFKMLLEAAPEAIVIVDENGKIILVNSQSEAYFGYRREEMLGQLVELLVPDESVDAHIKYREIYMKNPIKRPMGTGKNLRAKRKDGTTFPVDISLSPFGSTPGIMITSMVHDITLHKQMEERLKHLAEHDPLTGLVNRLLLEDRTKQALVLANRYEWSVAVFFMDLDGFKQVNDTYGHAVGDLLLCAVTTRIQECTRQVDTLARVGGDEFILLLLEIKNDKNATKIAEHIIKRIAEEFLIENRRLTTSISIGISLYPKDAANYQSLIEKADAAMYYAKTHGKNNFKLYSEVD